jgi:hypothetical protein
MAQAPVARHLRAKSTRKPIGYDQLSWSHRQNSKTGKRYLPEAETASRQADERARSGAVGLPATAAGYGQERSEVPALR